MGSANNSQLMARRSLKQSWPRSFCRRYFCKFGLDSLPVRGHDSGSEISSPLTDPSPHGSVSPKARSTPPGLLFFLTKRPHPGVDRSLSARREGPSSRTPSLQATQCHSDVTRGNSQWYATIGQEFEACGRRGGLSPRRNLPRRDPVRLRRARRNARSHNTRRDAPVHHPQSAANASMQTPCNPRPWARFLSSAPI